jgi:hypothetical protein
MKRKMPTPSMTALCIAQPWAFCIIEMGKNIENRSQNLKKRGTIAIYASRSLDNGRFEYCNEDLNVKVSAEDVPFGAIIGFVDIVDVITKKQVTKKTKKWFSGEYGYVLENPVFLKKPVPAKPKNGVIKFWELKGKVLEKCLSQLSSSQIKKFKSFE